MTKILIVIAGGTSNLTVSTDYKLQYYKNNSRYIQEDDQLNHGIRHNV